MASLRFMSVEQCFFPEREKEMKLPRRRVQHAQSYSYSYDRRARRCVCPRNRNETGNKYYAKGSLVVVKRRRPNHARGVIAAAVDNPRVAIEKDLSPLLPIITALLGVPRSARNKTAGIRKRRRGMERGCVNVATAKRHFAAIKRCISPSCNTTPTALILITLITSAKCPRGWQFGFVRQIYLQRTRREQHVVTRRIERHQSRLNGEAALCFPLANSST